MKKILLKIANLLYINLQYMDSYGLLNGKMGAVLFFYEYSRYSGNEMYGDFADRMLDEVLDAIEAKRVDGSASLDNGLGGIGWGLQYLIDHQFTEGDADEVLADFDKRMGNSINGLSHTSVEEWSKYISENEFFLGLDVYLYARRAKRDFYTLDNLREIADFYMKILGSERVFPLQFLNSCHLFLVENHPFMKGRYTLLLRDRLEAAYRKAVEQERYVASDLDYLQRFGEQGKTLFDFSYLLEHKKMDACWQTGVDAYLKYVKAELLSFDSQYHLLDEETINNYLNKGMEDMPSCNLSLGEGMSGLGLSIIKALKP